MDRRAPSAGPPPGDTPAEPFPPSPPGSLEVGTRWESAGEHYATDRWKGPRAKTRDQDLVRRLLRRLPKTSPPPLAVLDAPCGAGRMRHAVDAPWTGMDISPSMLAQAKATGAPVLQASAAALPFGNSAFDTVLCCRLIHHYAVAEDRQRVLDELLRVAGRYVLLSYWDAKSLTAWRRRTRGPLRRRKGHGVRFAIPWETLRAEIESRGGEVLGRAFSMRLVSAQTFVLIAKSRVPERDDQ